MLTHSQIETFKIGLGRSNTSSASWADEAAMIEAGDDIVTSIVETPQETLNQHVLARRRAADEVYDARGCELHVWRDVQFQKGQPRHTVYYMDFGGGMAAAMQS